MEQLLLLYDNIITNRILLVAIVVSFEQSTYSVNEDDGPVQSVLVLSNPSSTNITIQVKETSGAATSEPAKINCTMLIVTLPYCRWCRL